MNGEIMMVGVKTHTFTSVNGIDNLEMVTNKLKSLVSNIRSVYYAAKIGTIEGLEFENVDRVTREGPALDCGIVKCSRFTIEKTDLYGDNPMYTYVDGNGRIFLQENYLLNSSVTLTGRENLSLSAFQFLEDDEVKQYVDTVDQNMLDIMSTRKVKSGNQR